MADTPTSTKIDITSTSLTTAATNYAAGDVIGPATGGATAWTASGFAINSGGSGVITAVQIIDDGDVFGSCSIYVYDTTLSVTDNSAFTPSDSDAANQCARIDLPPATDLGGVREAYVSGYWPYKTSGGTSLWFVVVTRSAVNVFTANDDMHLRFFITQLS